MYLKKHLVFHDMTFLNAIFINQLHNIIQTNCKTCYVGSAQVFLLHPIRMTNVDCSDTEICKNTSLTFSQQKPTTSIIQYETGSELSPLSRLVLRCENKAMVPNTKKKLERVRKRVRHWALYLWKIHALFGDNTVLFCIKFMLWTSLLTVYWLLNTVNDLIRPTSN